VLFVRQMIAPYLPHRRQYAFLVGAAHD